MNENYKKFNEAELLIGFFFFFGVDLVALAFDATVVGTIVAFCLQVLTTFVIEWWLESKGSTVGPFNAKRFGKFFSNAIPIIPTNSVIFLISAFRHNHPKALGIIGQVAGAAAGGAVAGPAGAKIGSAMGQYAASEKR